MRKRLTIIVAALSLTACIVIVHATPAQDRLWATRVKCELQTAGAASLPDLVWQQGSTPLLSLDQFRVGKSVDADSNVVAIVRFGPSATNAYFVTTTNYAVSANGYLVQLPTIGTNTTAVGTGADWWYTAYFERAGYRYWTGNGRVKIVATTSTADGLVWQTITGVSVAALQSALDAEAQARAAGDLVAMTNWQAVVYSLTNGAALGATALQPAWAETGAVFRAIEVIGAQSTLIETAWQNPAAATNWTWTSDGNEVTLTGYSGPNAVVIPDMLNGLPVTGFGGIFNGNMDITSVGGGANVKEVDNSAFFGCWALNSVSLPACTTVGDSAFRDCMALNSVSLPACTTVGDSAFRDCMALNSVTFGQNAPAPAVDVFAYSTPTIYVSNPHATGWGDTWNGRPVVRAASMADIPTLPGPGCTVLDYAADGTNVTITGATYSYFFAPDKAYTLSVAPDAPRYHYSIEIIGDHACTLPAGHRLRGSWTITGTNEVVVAPSTGTVWNVFGRGL